MNSVRHMSKEEIKEAVSHYTKEQLIELVAELAISELREIVENQDLRLLEAYCLPRTYKQVIADAKRQRIDLDLLEELLGEIS
jgi:hypothetical protein